MARPRSRSTRTPRRSAKDGPGAVLPQELSNTLKPLLGSELNALEKALGDDPPTSVRLNPAKPTALSGDKVPWCDSGMYLKDRPVFTLDPLFHAGAYYVQEASSMFLEQALKHSGLQEREVLALDLCAAPGGKTTHLRSLLSHGSLLVANEVDGRRRSILEENLWKWGRRNVVLAGSRTTDLERIPELFDLILADAPCSGEGMIRKDAHAGDQWKPALVVQCASVQGSILAHAWTALRPGGILIYSTCTWELSENEQQIAGLLAKGAEVVDIPLEPAWGIERSERKGGMGYRFYPHRLDGEGFFLAMLRKPGTIATEAATRIEQKEHHEVRPWLQDEQEQWISAQGDLMYALDGRWKTVVERMTRAMRILAPGIPVAERKGAAWRPHPALALNELLRPGHFPVTELSHDEALHYLRGNSLLCSDARGVSLASYQGHPLGWLQGAGTRWNNRWPVPWRIRMQQR